MKKQRKSSRKAMLNRSRSRKTSPTYLAAITSTGDIQLQPMNRKAYKLEISRMRRSDGITTKQHAKEVRKQRLTKQRRALSKVQKESRAINRA